MLAGELVESAAGLGDGVRVLTTVQTDKQKSGLYRFAALRAWESRPFRRYFLASALSTTGRALQMTVIGFIVFDLTGSKFLLGLVSFMQMVPVLFMAPVVGVIVDNFERRRILALTFSALATGFLALAALSILGQLTIPAIAIIVVLMGIAMAFTFPARSALVPNLVERDALQSAIAANSMLMNASRMAIPAIGGYIINVAGVSVILLVGAGAYYPAAAVILTVPLLASTMGASVARRPFNPSRAVGSFVGDLRDALGYIRGNLMLRASLFNDVVPFMFGMSYVALLPAIALETLDGDAGTLGLLHGVSGAGALVGTFFAGALAGRSRRGMVIWVSMLGWGLALFLVAAGSSLTLIISGLVLTGFFQTLYIVQNDTLIQLFAVDRYRGRVIAAQSMINGLTTIGFLEIGVVAAIGSISLAVALHGAALVAIAVVTILFRPAMRDLR